MLRNKKIVIGSVVAVVVVCAILAVILFAKDSQVDIPYSGENGLEESMVTDQEGLTVEGVLEENGQQDNDIPASTVEAQSGDWDVPDGQSDADNAGERIEEPEIVPLDDAEKEPDSSSTNNPQGQEENTESGYGDFF